MVELTIDNKKVTVPEGTTILEAAKTAGLLIPNLCYLKGINEIGACRVCVVDVQGSHKLVTSCNTPVQPGMEVRTNTPRAREARRTNYVAAQRPLYRLCQKRQLQVTDFYK